MPEETLRILKLLEAGKISSKEAEDLLSALKPGDDGSASEDADGHTYPFHGHGHGHHGHHGQHPAAIVAEVMREINPGRIVSEAMDGIGRPPRPPRPPHVLKLHGLEALADIGECCFGRASAEDEQTVTVPAAGVTALTLSQPRSDIQVRGGDTDQVTIKADIQVWAGDQDEADERLKSLKLVAENDNGTLRVKLDGPPWTKKRWTSADFEITLPRSVALELGTASGDITLEGCHAGATLNTASGDVNLTDCRGEIAVSSASGDVEVLECAQIKAQVQTVSGDIGLDGCSGAAVVQTVSGDVEVQIDGNFSATSVSGDVQADVANAGNIVVHSTSGDIDLEVASAAALQLALISISGDVSLELPDNASAALEAVTTSGDIECDLDLAGREQKSRRLTGQLGGGEGRISVSTTSGDISIS